MTIAVLLIGLLIGAVVTVGLIDLWREYREQRKAEEYRRWLEARRAARMAWMRATISDHPPVKYEPIQARDEEHTEGWN